MMDLLRAIERCLDEPVGVLLMPGDTAKGSPDPQPQIVAASSADLTGRQYSPGSVFKPQQHCGIIVKITPGHMRRQIGTEMTHRKSGHVGDEVFRMGTNITPMAPPMPALEGSVRQ